MMVAMEIMLVSILAVALTAAVAAIVWLALTRRSGAPGGEVPARAVEQAVALGDRGRRPAGVAQRDLAVQASLEQALLMMREQLGLQVQQADTSLAGRQQLIDAKLGEVQAGVQTDLDRLSQLVQQLGNATSERFGQVDRSLQVHSEITQTLAGTANSLREALASSNARGQWGERMAEDVLRLAGMQEHVNYVKRTAVERRGHRHPRLHLRAAQGARAVHGRQVPDGRVPALSRRRHRCRTATRTGPRSCATCGPGCANWPTASTRATTIVRRSTTCCCSSPTRRLAAFIHESDHGLVEEAMRQHVVICSPLTLFAFLGVIRQAFDNFMIEQTSQEILRAARQVRSAVGQVRRIDRQGEASVRHRRPLVRRAGHHPSPGARTTAQRDRRSAPPPGPARRRRAVRRTSVRRSIRRSTHRSAAGRQRARVGRVASGREPAASRLR